MTARLTAIAAMLAALVVLGELTLSGDGSKRWDVGHTAAVAAAFGLAVLHAVPTWRRRGVPGGGLDSSAGRRSDRRDVRYRALVHGACDVSLVVGRDMRVRDASESVERIFGIRAAEVVGRLLTDHVHPEDHPLVVAWFHELLGTDGGEGGEEFRLRAADGTWRHVDVASRNLIAEPAVDGVVMSLRDVTERHRLDPDLEHRALLDPLTGLPNRSLFLDRVEQALHRSHRKGAPVTVLCLDLDGFKSINDTFGHRVGDRLLVAVAERLAHVLRAADTVARLGGDEFALLVDELQGERNAVRVAERVLEALAAPFELDGRELAIDASIGLAETTGTEDAHDLLRNADVAMYRAKAVGRGRYEQFDPSMDADVSARLELEADLRHAVEREEFFLEYQPIVDLNSGAIEGVEALIRWHHPRLGVVLPGAFIPLAEETGAIGPIGAWVLGEASRQLAEWQREFPATAPRTVAVNVSARQFHRAGIVEEVAGALAVSGLDPYCLVVELTESYLMDDAEGATVFLKRLKELGVLLAIDDFGTGYSSLSYLRRFPIDILKVDRAFVQGLGRGPEESALARAIVKLGYAFRIKTVGEGIEREEQAEALRIMGCHAGQGYLFSAPVGAAGIEAMLGAERPVLLDTARVAEMLSGATGPRGIEVVADHLAGGRG